MITRPKPRRDRRDEASGRDGPAPADAPRDSDLAHRFAGAEPEIPAPTGSVRGGRHLRYEGEPQSERDELGDGRQLCRATHDSACDVPSRAEVLDLTGQAMHVLERDRWLPAQL